MTGKAENQSEVPKSIVIPLNDERILGEFIASLLGQSRYIQREFSIVGLR
jgi:hypothetical protein